MIKALKEEVERPLLAKRDNDNHQSLQTAGFCLFHAKESDPHLLLQSYKEALSWKDPTPIFD